MSPTSGTKGYSHHHPNNKRPLGLVVGGPKPPNNPPWTGLGGAQIPWESEPSNDLLDLRLAVLAAGDVHPQDVISNICPDLQHSSCS